MPLEDLPLLQLDNGSLSLGISPLGAELQYIRLPDGRDLLWNGDAAYWTGRAPILFPIVGRAPDDTIAVNGRTAEMRQHGFARRSVFKLEKESDAGATFVLTDSEETRAVYPFAFRLSLSYELEGATLIVTAEVENRSDTDMPFGLGFHPAFLWPLPGAEGRTHRITLDNGEEPALTRLQNGYLTDERLPSPFRAGELELDHGLFADDAMIFPEGSGPDLRYDAPESAAPSLRFRFQNTPNLGIWSKPGAPFLCIEPWHGMAARLGAGAEIAERPDSVTLAPGASQSFGFMMTVL